MDSRITLLARLRGAFVGSMAWATSIAGHGLGGGTMALTESDLLLLTLSCAAVGAVVSPSQVRKNQWLPLLALLGGGQILGHTILTFSHGHAMPGIMPSVPMLAGHITVMFTTAALVRCAEHGLLRVFGMVRKLLKALAGPGATAPLWVAVLTAQNWACRFLLWCSTAGTRGPPVPA
ncbi:hypothetical protein [Williamsia sp.]|uniref:hypothetical protein n=1 Tax=Williamsia sp. TaxID=1872085 RepID=UPI002F93EC24